jgi:hypothetical protein
MDWLRKKLKGYRTILVNVLMTIMPLLEMSEVLDVMPDGWQNWYAIAMAVINLWLRSITTTPMGKRL